MADRPRIVFMGTPDFAVPSLAACVELGEVVRVVTQPDKPKGRGRELAAPPVKTWALGHGLAVSQPEKLKAGRFHEELVPLAPDRGAAPIQWAIANGEAKTGVCLMRLEAGLDTGPLFACAEMAIGPDDTGGSMHDALAILGADLLRAELPAYLAGERTPVPQDHAQATLAPILKKEDGRLDFGSTARLLEARLRAFTPWPGAFTFIHGKLVKVLRARAAQGRGEPGEVIEVGTQGIELACKEGSLVLLELLPEGKRPMSAAQFLAGHPLARGERIG